MNDNFTLKKCLNCQAELSNESNFCPNCGAHQPNSRLSTKEVFSELLDVVLIWNKDFFKTFFHLLFRPTRVITYYIQGGRNRYMNPLLYLLFCFFLYLLLSSLLGRGVFFISGMKGFIAGINEAGNTESLNENAIDNLNSFSKILFFLILPILAFFSLAIFRSNRMNYAEHLSISAYQLGQIIFLGTVTTSFAYILDWNGINYISMLIIVLYLIWCQYQIFQNKILYSFLKSLGFILINIFIIIILYLIIAFAVASIVK